MIRILVLFALLLRLIQLNTCVPGYRSTSTLIGSAYGVLAMLPLGCAFCNHGKSARQRIRQSTSSVIRKMNTMKPTPVTILDTEANPLDTSRRSDKILCSLPETLKTWFDISLPEGRCIGVEKFKEADCFPQDLFDGTSTINNDHWLRSVFHQDEVEFGMKLKKDRNSFLLGRLALRIALDFPDYPILKDDHGRPRLRDDVFASISHKRDKGIAIVSPPVTDVGNSNIVLSGVGIDLEVTSRPGRPSIAKRILTANERNSLGNLPGMSIDEEVLLRFSLKEAIYKASHPLLRQYVGFQEAEVTPYEDGTATCTWLLDTKVDERIAKLTAHWKRLANENYFLTSASVYRKSS